MKIRRFFAKDMRSGLADVSKEMGPEAAILSTNSVNGGIEIVAATDYEQSLLDPRHRNRGEAKNKHKEQSPQNTTAVSRPHYSDTVDVLHAVSSKQKLNTETAFSTPVKTFKDTLQRQQLSSAMEVSEKSATKNHKLPLPSGAALEKVAQQKNIKPKRELENEAMVQNSRDYAPVERKNEQLADQNNARQDFKWGVDPVISGVKDELELIRGLLQSQLAELSWTHKLGADPVSAELLKRLVALGLPVSLAEVYTNRKQSAELKDAWYQVAAAMAHDIKILKFDPVQQGGCYALVGPTGVGKTTTIAKLAAMAAIKYGVDSVAMISTDSYRIAAHEQLTVYGQIMGVQVVSVTDAASLNRTLQRLAEKRLILIDTAGIGQRDKRLAEQVACLTRSGENIRNLLVLSATAQLAATNESVQRFGELQLDGAILTKLDEATSLGPALTTLIRTGLAVSFITNGQNVPDDIHPARAHDLVTEAINLANSYPAETQDDWRIAQELKIAG